MVWSEQIGSSITVPSDWIPGDTRNHMTIGEDVPAEIADHFTAVFTWWSGGYTGNPDTDFPNGFKYWALGISKNGNLELVAYYYIVSAPTGGGYTYFRQTLLSSSPPVGVDNAPVLSLGYNSNYASYGEGITKVVAANGIQRTSDGASMYPAVLLGSDIPAGTMPLIQYGSVTVTTNGSGDAAVNFAQAFPKACVMVIPQSGDWSTATTINPWSAPTTTGFSIRAYGATGATLPSHATKVNYMAIGY